MQNGSSQRPRDDVVPNAVTKVLAERSPLHQAVVLGDDKTVELILSTGADRNAKDPKHGNTPLHEAAWRGYSRCVKNLCALPKPAPVTIAPTNKETNKSKQTKAALQNTQGALHSALLSTRNAGGFSALHLAAQNGHNQSCREILLAGANPDVQNNYGDTPLHTACRYGHAGATRILLSAKCDPLRVNLNGDTALHIACAMGRRKLTRILLQSDSSASLKIRNAQSETARNIAHRKQLLEILEILDAAPPSKSTIPAQPTTTARIEERERSSSGSRHNKKDDKITNKKRNKEATTSTQSPTDSKKKTINWSPYGCHYFPDPRSFPSPKLETLPKEPLNSGEQYFLDLAGNIKKGPVGVGNTCYCGPFFRHIEERISRNKKNMKKFVHKATEKLDSKVQALALKTDDQIEQITRSMMADRIRCNDGRRHHLEQWLKRGDQLRATIAPHTSKHCKIDSNMNTLTRCRSLEFLDSDKFGNKLNYSTAGLRRSIDVLESNEHEIIVHRSADDIDQDDMDVLRSSSVERQSNLTVSGSERNRQHHHHQQQQSIDINNHRDHNSAYNIERMGYVNKERSTITSKSGSEYSKEFGGLVKAKQEPLSVAERLEELLSKTNEIIHMERIARRKCREGLTMLDIKQRTQKLMDKDSGLKVSSTSQHGSGSGASAEDDCRMKKFHRHDYGKPTGESDENSLIAHEMERITSSLLGTIGNSNERIIIGKEDDMPVSPRISKEFLDCKEYLDLKSRGIQMERTNGLDYIRNNDPKLTSEQSSDDQQDDNDDNESDLSEEEDVQLNNGMAYDHYKMGQYYQSDEVDGDVLTTQFNGTANLNQMSSVNCGFYQNTCFDDFSSSSNNTMKSVRHMENNENVTNSASDEVDSRCDLPQMANTKELVELKSRILNGAQWRRKSVQDVNTLAIENHTNRCEKISKIDESPINESLIKYYKDNGLLPTRGQKNKILELVAKFQGQDSQAISNTGDNVDESESSEDELDGVADRDYNLKRAPYQNDQTYQLPSQRRPMLLSPKNVQLDNEFSIKSSESLQNVLPYVNKAQPQVAKPNPPYILSNSNRSIDTRSLIPKDAYFHELPNKSHIKPIANSNLIEKTRSPPHFAGRNRNPLPLNLTTDGDILYSDRNLSVPSHMYVEKSHQQIKPQSIAVDYHFGQHQSSTSEKLLSTRKFGSNSDSMSTELEITQINSQPFVLSQTAIEHANMQTKFIADPLQIERDMNNDSGYSRMCGSSHGASPSLSGQTDPDQNGVVATTSTTMITNNNSKVVVTPPATNNISHPVNYIQKNGNNYIFASVGASSLV